MWGCCSSWFRAQLVELLIVYSRDVNTLRAHIQPAVQGKRGAEQCLYQHPQTQTAADKHGAAQTPQSCMQTCPQKIGLQLRRWPRLQWSGLDRPNVLTSSLLTCGWSLFSSFPFFRCLFFPDAHRFSYSLPLSPLSYPCFFPTLFPVLLGPYSNFPRLPRQYGPYVVLLIWFPRQCWPCKVLLPKKSLMLHSSALWSLAISRVAFL